ncbi:MAG TPA: hypothetical protein VN376_03210 [Longilinea sp.]|nr:hypothetical protein [Longilinea sp.]
MVSNSLSPVCIVIFILVIVVAFIAAMIYSKKRGKSAASAAQQVGFVNESKPDIALMERLEEIFQPSKVNRVEYLGKRVEGDELIYIFDIMTSSPRYYQRQRSSGNSEYRTVAVISPHLNLPPFLLVGRVNAPAFVGNAINDMMDMGASMAGYTEVENIPPAFSLNYSLYVKEDVRNNAVFTDTVLTQIAQVPLMVARGMGDTLVFNTMDARRGIVMDANAIAAHVTKAIQLVRWLSR